MHAQVCCSRSGTCRIHYVCWGLICLTEGLQTSHMHTSGMANNDLKLGAVLCCAVHMPLSGHAYLANNVAWIRQQRVWQALCCCKGLVVFWAVATDAKHGSTGLDKLLILITELADLRVNRDVGISYSVNHVVHDERSHGLPTKCYKCWQDCARCRKCGHN